MSESIQTAANRLRQARHLAVMTGSGISAASGIPTFRDPQDGIWSNDSVHEMATMQAFTRDPQRVWQWYRWRRQTIQRSQPNPAHSTLARWQQRFFPSLSLTTQNVDGLHKRAGSTDVAELHGNIHRFLCHVCETPLTLSEPQANADAPPACTHCRHGLARPAVVWFGEALPEATYQQAYRDAQKSDVYMVIGTSGVVEPAASLARVASQKGAYVIEINPDRTALTPWCTTSISGEAASVLPALAAALEAQV